MHIRHLFSRIDATRAIAALALSSVVLALPSHAGIATLKNGMKVEGRMGKVHSLAEDPAAGAAARVQVKQIVLLDDGLRRTYVSSMQIQPPLAESGPAGERIVIDQRVVQTGRRIGGVGPILQVEPFDRWGRRIFSMNTPRGPVDIIQGITEITPVYTKVEGLLGKYGYVWDMRLATSSIPRETLSAVLEQHLDENNPDDRLRIVRLYIQSERYQDARMELESVIERFPQLAELNKQVRQLRQLGAERLVREIEFRRDAGQHRLAYAMAKEFPTKDIAGETLLAVKDILGQYDLAKQQAADLLERLETQVNKVENPGLKARLAPVHEEIARDLDMHTFSRLADFRRLSDDKDLTPDQKVALAISAWVLGSGEGTENLAVALSLIDVRDAVLAYLRSDNLVQRADILKRLESLEGSDPVHVAKIVAHMAPPKETRWPAANPPAANPPAANPPAANPPAANQPEANQPEANQPDAIDPDANQPGAIDPDANQSGANEEAAETSIPGLLELTTEGLDQDPVIRYHVQLPPEYDPYRNYPCVVTLNGAGTTPLHQIDWWAGGYGKASKMRLGQASRRGYVVIAPHWTRPNQRTYDYSAREHAAVMFSLRDACKRFSIDTDRVFLSGHSMGGDAAWDIGLAHPDVWAGVIPIVATADKFVSRYWENGRGLPMYFVCGQLDGNRMSINGAEWDRYLTKHDFDCMVVEYKGRGHEHFHDEIQRLFEWMGLHSRNFFPREFECYSMRTFDNYFWWVELHGMPDRNMVAPSAWPPSGSARPIPTEGRILENNRVSVRTGADRPVVWLSPEMVDFSQRVTVTVNGRSRGSEIRPSTETLLEDVRTRGDRRHPFWAKYVPD